jgi:O-antigen ligase
MPLVAEADNLPPSRPRTPPALGVRAWAGAAVAGALGLGAGVLASGGVSESAVIVAGAGVGVGLLTLAATRFWWVVLALFMTRSSLDALKLGHYAEGSSSLDPGVIVGLVFLLSGATWLAVQWWSGTWRPLSATSRWFAALGAAGIAAAVLSPDPLASGRVALKLCAGALMYAVLEQALRSRPERLKALLVATGASVAVPAAVALSQLRSPRELEAYLDVSRIRGTFVHPNPFATYLVLLCVVAVALLPHVRGVARWFSGAVAAVSGFFAFFTYARGAWIALFLGLVVIGILQDRRILGALAAGTVAVVLFVPSFSSRLSDLDNEAIQGRGDPNSLAWRISYWQELLPQMADNPITGIGLDQVLRTSEDSLQPHNVVVQTAVEMGLVGLTCLIGLGVAMGRELRRAVRTSTPGLHRGLAVGAIGAAVGVLFQFSGENLLTQAAIHWYLAVPVIGAIALAVQHRRDGEASATPVEPAELAPPAGPAAPALV